MGSSATSPTIWGLIFIIFGSVSFGGFLYAAVISKLLPPSDNSSLSYIQRDRYSSCLTLILKNVELSGQNRMSVVRMAKGGRGKIMVLPWSEKRLHPPTPAGPLEANILFPMLSFIQHCFNINDIDYPTAWLLSRYYCFLVPLSIPILVVAVYFHWLSMKLFKHA
ncbi:hypothetical protein Cgig2_016196 [Carnegiea gigantea]|uniref:Uncharacterized protein n=1 Tax=Carnegiea gigantea TaxID=171969 RepID=A0A9Q1KQ97_9CARY|nr:hypothetical protein Cgig2_016196 [Carnegiea gigantea]